MSSPPDFSEGAKWAAASLRLTAFQVDSVNGQGWWQSVVGEDPETEAKKSKGLVYEVAGLVDSRGLSLSIDPVKISWILAPAVEVESLLDEDLPSLGPFPEALTSFRSLLNRWLETCPAIKRLAVGAILLLPAEDSPAGYRKLNELLSTVEVDPESSDFQYRVNRPRPSSSGVPDLRINRLATWSTVRLERKLEADGKPLSTDLPLTQYACRLELDINTPHSRDDALPHEKLPALFEELSSLALEIATCGDIR